MELEELVEAVKEAVGEQLEPLEERIVKLEADQAAINEGMKAKADKADIDALTDGVNQVVGTSKSIRDADPVTAIKSDSPRRDAWGRRVRSA